MEVPQISAQVELLPEDGVLLVSEHLTYCNCQREALSEIYLYTPPQCFRSGICYRTGFLPCHGGGRVLL